MKSNVNVEAYMNSDLIPETVYQSLPTLLSSGCNQFPNERERDVFFVSALGILSGMINIKGVYRRKWTHCNLYVMAVAPAANGKSAMESAKYLASETHAYLQQNQNQSLPIIGQDRASNPQQHKKMFGLFIPGDISDAAFVLNLRDNNEQGIICETEIDTMAKVMKQDWASGLSEKFRKAFQNESISVSRAFPRVVTYLSEPKLSIVLTGTPKQAIDFIGDPEHGLFSRIIYYQYAKKPEWEPDCEECENLDEIFKDLSKKFHEMYLYLEKYNCTFQLSASQKKEFDNSFTEQFNDVSDSHGLDAEGMIKRMGLITFRIALILSAIRRFETEKKESIEICSDLDFTTSMILGNYFAKQACLMMEQLPHSSVREILSEKEKLLKILPPKFERSEAIDEGLKHKFSVRTVDRFLKNSTNQGILIKEHHGRYAKS